MPDLDMVTAGRVHGVQSQPKRLDVQGLRAVAVISVVLFHIGLPIPGGFVGVDVFFVISGFVITAMLVRQEAAQGRIRLRNFYWHRFLRLTPALALMVSFTIVASLFLLSPLGSQQVAAQTGIGAMLLVANYVIASVTGGYFDAPAELNPLLHTWSLSVEEQFYLVFPLMLVIGFALVRKLPRMHWIPAGLVTAIGLGSLTLLALGLAGFNLPGVSVPPSFFSPFTRVWEFAAGSLLALVVGLKSKRDVPAVISGSVGIAGLGLILVSFFLINDRVAFPGPMTLLPVLGTVLVLLAGSWGVQPAGRLLSVPPMVRIGDWSYSIYLWHWPFIVFAAVLLPRSPLVLGAAVAVSLVPALLSYRWVEMPLRAFSPRSRRQSAAVVLFVVFVPIALSVALWHSANQGFWTSKGKELLTRSDTRFGEADGCVGPLPDLLPPVEDCTYNPAGSAKPIYLIGDSYAGQVTDAVAQAAFEIDSPFIPRTSGGCPFASIRVEETDLGREFSPDCTEFNESVVTWLSESRPGTVIVSNADFYFRDPAFTVQSAGVSPSNLETRKIDALRAGLSDAVETLQSHGHEVVLVQPIPNFRLETDAESRERWFGFSECPTILFFMDKCQLAAPESLSVIEERQAPIWDAISAVGEETGAVVLDLRTDLCPNGDCPVQQGETVMYSNYVHLSPEGSRKLAPRFIDQVASQATRMN